MLIWMQGDALDHGFRTGEALVNRVIQRCAPRHGQALSSIVKSRARLEFYLFL